MLLDTIICNDPRALNGEDHELTSHNARKNIKFQPLQIPVSMWKPREYSLCKSSTIAKSWPEKFPKSRYFPSMGKPNFASMKGLNWLRMYNRKHNPNRLCNFNNYSIPEMRIPVRCN